jgi:azurin
MLEMGRIEAALQEFAEAHKLAPTLGAAPYARALLNQGTTREAAGELAAALKSYEQAIQLAPPGPLRDEIALIIPEVKARLNTPTTTCPNCRQSVQPGWLRCPYCEATLGKPALAPAEAPAAPFPLSADRAPRRRIPPTAIALVMVLLLLGGGAGLFALRGTAAEDVAAEPTNVAVTVTATTAALVGALPTSTPSLVSITNDSDTTESVTIEIATDGEMLAFDKTMLMVNAGQLVTLTFNNKSAFMQHNWVLVSGDERAATTIAADGIAAGLGGQYLPSGNPNVLFHTAVLEGGESETITFTAPDPGTYLFICTVPGHYPLMQGTMIVN